jgi:hypothetical protein
MTKQEHWLQGAVAFANSIILILELQCLLKTLFLLSQTCKFFLFFMEDISS